MLALPTAYLILVCGYLLLLTLGAFLFKKNVQRGGRPLRMALLIPAHNEGARIGGILADAAGLNYPDSDYTVFVLADNCSDNTAALAAAAGTEVLERNDSMLRGKGQALDWALRTHAAVFATYDGIALVDADMYLDPAFLSEAAASLSTPGVRVVQGLNIVAHPERTWRTALGYAGFSVINHLRPAGRSWLGGTAGLRGSGMIFSSHILLQYGWPAHSIAEDAEFTNILLMDGVRVHYNPDAKVTSDIPEQESQARVQQERWDGGRLQVFRRYFPLLVRRAFVRPTRMNLDALLDLMVPPQSLLALLLIGAFLPSLLISPLWSGVIFLCACAVALAVFSSLLLTGAPAKVYLYLASAPLLILWKLPLYGRLLLRRGAQVWQRTPRDEEL